VLVGAACVVVLAGGVAYAWRPPPAAATWEAVRLPRRAPHTSPRP
jgi:hypothetical protein